MKHKQTVLTILKDKGECNLPECPAYRRCIFDTDCQGFKSDRNTKMMKAVRLLSAKEIIKMNPQSFKDEDLFDLMV